MMSKKICDNTLKSCFKVSNDAKVNNPVIARTVRDSITKKEFTIQDQPLPSEIKAIQKTDPVTKEAYMVLASNAIPEDDIPAFDSTFIGEFEDESGNKFIGRYNYITGEKVVAIPRSSSYDFLGYNYKNDLYYLISTGKDDYIEVYDGEGTLINSLITYMGPACNYGNGLAINYANNQVIIADEFNLDNQNTIVYNEDLTEVVQFIPDLDWEHTANLSPANGIFSRPDGGFVQINSTLKKINFLNANYEIEAEVFAEDFPANQDSFYCQSGDSLLKFIDDRLCYFYIDAQSFVHIAEVSFDGSFNTHPLAMPANVLSSLFFEVDKLGSIYLSENEANYGLGEYFYLNPPAPPALPINVIIEGKPIDQGFIAQGRLYISLQDNLILYGTWEDFTYALNTKTGEVNEIQYEPNSFHGTGGNSVTQDNYLKMYPAVPFKAFI